MVDHAPELPASPGGSRPAPATAFPADTPAQTHPETSDQPAPAELVPTPKRWERFAWYGGSVLLSVLLICAGLRLDRADLRAPFYYDLDALLMLPLVKATVEHGFGGHWQNEKMGAPGVMELYDFPVIDHLHFFVIWLMGQFVGNLVLLYNLYFLLTFPLTVLTAMIAFRHLGLTLPAAAVGGLLYSFLPYHYQRWENHYFLAAYWMIPISLLPAFAICRGNLPFFTKQSDGTYRRVRLRTWGTFGLVALAAATSAAGAYYAFFICAIASFAGVYGWVVSRTWRAAASAGAFIALIVAFGLVNHLPTFIYQAKYGRHLVTERLPEEADYYGLKITHLLLPVDDHNFRPFRTIKEIYNSSIRPSETENRSASLGGVAAAGLVGLVVMLVLPFRRVWPYGPLAGMAVFIVLLGTIGGFGSVFNLLVTGQIRGYNRISVVLAFPCLLASLWTLDRFLLSRASRRARRLRYPAWAALLLVGFLDQTPYSWFRSPIIWTINEAAERFHDDAAFFASIEERMPPGSKIFCLPYAGFPEAPPAYHLRAYEHARGYIHTDSLVWSYGAMKEREADVWQREVASKTTIPKIDRLGPGVEEFLHRLIYRGFDGLLIDMRGYPPIQNSNRARAIMQEIRASYASLVNNRIDHFNAKLPEIDHKGDGQQFFIDLRPYREELRALLNRHGPGPFEAKVREEEERLSIIWLGGFFCPMAETGEFDKTRYGRSRGTAWIINPSDRTRRVKMRMVFGIESSGQFHFTLSGLVNEEFDVQRKVGDWNDREFGITKEYVVEVPPGRHALRIRCDTPPEYVPSDARKLCYYIMNFQMDEVP